MKKLLLILAGFTLTATSTLNVVACKTKEGSDVYLDIPTQDYLYLTELYKNEVETYLLGEGISELFDNSIILGSDNEFEFLNYDALLKLHEDGEISFDKDVIDLLQNDLYKIININKIRNHIINKINSRVEFKKIKSNIEETKINYIVSNLRLTSSLANKDNFFSFEFDLHFTYNLSDENGISETIDSIDLQQNITIFNESKKNDSEELKKKLSDLNSKLKNPDSFKFQSDITNPLDWKNALQGVYQTALTNDSLIQNQDIVVKPSQIAYQTLTQRIRHSSDQRKELNNLLSSGKVTGDELLKFYEKVSSDSKGSVDMFSFSSFENRVTYGFENFINSNNFTLDKDKSIGFGRVNLKNLHVNVGGNNFILPEMQSFFIQETANVDDYKIGILSSVADFFKSIYYQKPETENTFMVFKKPEAVEFDNSYSYDVLLGGILNQPEVLEATKGLDKYGITPGFHANQFSLKNLDNFKVDKDGNIYATNISGVVNEINWSLKLFLSSNFNGANSISIIRDKTPSFGEATQFQVK